MNFLFMPAQAPAADPGTGIEARSAREAGGNERPDTVGLDRYQRSPEPEQQNGSGFPFQVPEGLPRPAMHPGGGTTGTLYQPFMDDQGGTEGRHGQLVQSSSSPDGVQLPYGSSPRTFRAQPGPWDSGYVNAGQSVAAPVVGDE